MEPANEVVEFSQEPSCTVKNREVDESSACLYTVHVYTILTTGTRTPTWSVLLTSQYGSTSLNTRTSVWLRLCYKSQCCVERAISRGGERNSDTNNEIMSLYRVRRSKLKSACVSIKYTAHVVPCWKAALIHLSIDFTVHPRLLG